MFRSTHRSRADRAALLCSLPMLGILAGYAQPTFAESPITELIVMLAPAPQAPSPDDLADAISKHEALPGAFSSGSPIAARPLLAERASGDFLAWLQANPEDPRARLERAVVIAYPASTDLEATAQILLGDPSVRTVEENGTVELFLQPNDPLFPQTPGTQGPQWGLHLLNFPAAWDYARGRGYVGVADTGLEIQTPDCPGVSFETGHEDLRAFHRVGGTTLFQQGNFRRRFAVDVGNPVQPDRCVDELQPETVVGGTPGQIGVTDFAGHGTHVSGIIAATTGNSTGVAGSGWSNGLMFARTSNLIPCVNVACQIHNADVTQIQQDQNIVAAITRLVDMGAQVINMSFGKSIHPACTVTEPPPTNEIAYCSALRHAHRRGVTMVAASGNSTAQQIAFPARDPRVIAVGGLQFPANLWFSNSGFGSNTGAQQELVAPARDVVSTFYTGQVHNPGTGCADSGLPGAGTGYGLCTGTSMAAPHISGLAGLLRSVDPVLSHDSIRAGMISRASQATQWTPQLGYGYPNALGNVEDTLGRIAGRVIRNRATPLYSLYGSTATDHFYTSVPQMAVAAVRGSNGATYSTIGPAVPGTLPGCELTPCPNGSPKASLHVLSTENNPIPGGQPLVPLYRLSRFASGGNNRDHRYDVLTTEVVADHGAGYYLDGIEGYLYPSCGTDTTCDDVSCQPAGTVAVLRRYNAPLDDTAIFPANELGTMSASGYTQVLHGRSCLGWAYPNADADSDGVIDGFERLVGPDPAVADSDCDGNTDGAEMLGFPRQDPVANPLCSRDKLFADWFDSGDVSAWTTSVLGGAGSLTTLSNPGGGSYGPWSLAVSVQGGAADVAYVRHDLVESQQRYRARFQLNPAPTGANLTMATGDEFNVLVVRSSTDAKVRVALRRVASGYRIVARVVDNGGVLRATPQVPVSLASSIEIEWRAAQAPAANGYLLLYVDGVLAGHVAAVNNSGQAIASALFGIVGGVDPGTSGTLLVDGFVSRRLTYIGP